MTQSNAQRPAEHPAWTRATDAGEISADTAQALAQQVAAVIPERDYLLMCCQGDAAALEEVWLPAVLALYAAWIETVGPGFGPSRGAGQRHRGDFAALAACAAHLAWSCQDFARASVLAYRARIAAPTGPGLALAEQVARDAAARTSPGGIASIVALDTLEAVLTYRRHRAEDAVPGPGAPPRTARHAA